MSRPPMWWRASLAKHIVTASARSATGPAAPGGHLCSPVSPFPTNPPSSGREKPPPETAGALVFEGQSVADSITKNWTSTLGTSEGAVARRADGVRVNLLRIVRQHNLHGVVRELIDAVLVGGADHLPCVPDEGYQAPPVGGHGAGRRRVDDVLLVRAGRGVVEHGVHPNHPRRARVLDELVQLVAGAEEVTGLDARQIAFRIG